MSLIELPAALAREATEEADPTRALALQWIEPAVAILFAAAAVILASSLAVVSGLV
jgi:hypothetical protein